MIDFPASPTPGQVFNPGTGPIYTWDGVAWNLTPVQVKTARPKNMIVNPCALISQENGRVAGTVTAYFVADQWSLRVVASGGVVSAKSDALFENPSGSTCRLSHKTTTAKVTLAAADYSGFNTTIEGTRAYPLKWHASDPQQTVLRFGFKGPAGTYSAAMRNQGPRTVTWVGTFTITAGQANTDTEQTLVIPPPPSGHEWQSSTAGELDLWITLAAGSSFIAPVKGWQDGQFIAGPGQSNLLGTVNSEAQVWDIGLYADPDKTGIPPPFEVPDYAADLLDCQRYFEVCSVTANGTQSPWQYPGWGYKAMKRASPTLSIFSGTPNGAVYANQSAMSGAWGFRQNTAASSTTDQSVASNARM